MLSDTAIISQGKLITLDNFFEIFNEILNPKQLEGLRLLVTPFPQQQFNATDDPPQPPRQPRCGVLRLPC